MLAPVLEKAKEKLGEEVHDRMHRGGSSAREEYFTIRGRFANSDDQVGLKKFQREHFPLLPRADRDNILRLMLESYEEDSSEFVKMTRSMSEADKLRLMETIVMED